MSHKNPEATCINPFTGKGTFDADHQSHQAYRHQLLCDFHPKILTWQGPAGMWGLKCHNFGHSIHPWKPTHIKAQQENVLPSVPIWPSFKWFWPKWLVAYWKEKVKIHIQKVLTVRHCHSFLVKMSFEYLRILTQCLSPKRCEWMIKDVQLLHIMDTSEVLSMYFQSKCWEPSKTRSLGATASRMDLSWSIRAMVRHLLGLKLGNSNSCTFQHVFIICFTLFYQLSS